MIFAAVRSALGSRAVVPSSRAARSIDFPYHFACRRRLPELQSEKFPRDSESPTACLSSELIFPIILHAGAACSPRLQFLNCLPKNFHVILNPRLHRAVTQSCGALYGSIEPVSWFS